MGEPLGRRPRRRVLPVLTAAAIVCGLLFAAPSAAHAVLACPGGGTDCLTAVEDTYTTSFTIASTRTAPCKGFNVAKPGLLANDYGPAGTAVDILNSDPTSFNDAQVCAHADGSFSYLQDPATPFTGDDTFDYFIKNSVGDWDFATVTIVVKPALHDDAYTTKPNTTLNVAAPGVFANDLGIDRSTALDTFQSTSVHGGAVTMNTNGSFKYVPKTGFQGTDSFKYTVWDINFDHLYSATVRVQVSLPPPPPPPPTKPKGYWMVGATGTVYPFGQVRNYGNAPDAGITHLEPTPSRLGYWVVNAAGRVFAFGDARVFGGAPTLRPGEIVSSLSSTPTGKGYWLFTNRGKAVARGDARFLGDVRNLTLNGPVVGSVATPTGNGYYMVGSDGGIFSFGDARFRGSMGGVRLNRPVNSIVPTATNRGYWLVASDGGIFSFGDATFRGSMGGTHLNQPIIGMVRYGNGYLMVASDGGIFAFSNLPFLGSLGNAILPAPIVGVAAGG